MTVLIDSITHRRLFVRTCGRFLLVTRAGTERKRALVSHLDGASDVSDAPYVALKAAA